MKEIIKMLVAFLKSKKEIIMMILVLSAICFVCGFLLAAVKNGTEERREEQILLNVKGPAVKKVLEGSTNDLIKDRQTVKIDDKELIVFIGKENDTPWAFAFETASKGFGGEIGVIVGFSLRDDILTGIGITTLKETPGLGARVTEDAFTNGFKNKPLSSKFSVKGDGGIIDAVSGATISSKGVCSAVRDAIQLSKEIKSRIK